MEQNTLEKVQSYQYPRAHQGHLTSAQEFALGDFKSLCEEQGYYKPAGPSGKPRASHDDETLLRYLRARKFVPKEAFNQFKDTEQWRKENKLEELYNTIDVKHYEETRRLYPQWTGRRDKRGIPVYCFEVATLNTKTMAIYEKAIVDDQSKTTKLMRLFALYENLTRFVLPLCSAVSNRPYPETPVSQSNNIVDISRVGLKQFWNLKAHMQDASQLATAHYPETLDRIFIIGAPSFFPTVWSWIKRWFDPITVSKIFILSSQDMQSTLELYIDPSNIPKKYGGQLDWSWGDRPVLEPAIQDTLNWVAPDMQKSQSTFPIGPIRWKESENGTMTALAVGSVEGSPRNKAVAMVPSKSKTSRLSVQTNQDSLFAGPPSTTGTHTHPEDGQGYFPSSGDTPTDEKGEEILQNVTSPPQTAGDLTMEPGKSDATTIPTRAPNRISEQSSIDELSPPSRTGTSSTRFEQQGQTLAQGQLADGTPEIIDLGNGDKTASVETSTVGQAPKDVSVPIAQPLTEVKDTSYLGQAKAVASSAYATTASAVSTVSNTVTAAVGFGSTKEGDDEAKQAHLTPKPEDPRIDELSNNQVEDIIRTQQMNLETETEGKGIKAN